MKLSFPPRRIGDMPPIVRAFQSDDLNTTVCRAKASKFLTQFGVSDWGYIGIMVTLGYYNRVIYIYIGLYRVDGVRRL